MFSNAKEWSHWVKIILLGNTETTIKVTINKIKRMLNINDKTITEICLQVTLRTLEWFQCQIFQSLSGWCIIKSSCQINYCYSISILLLNLKMYLFAKTSFVIPTCTMAFAWTLSLRLLNLPVPVVTCTKFLRF